MLPRSSRLRSEKDHLRVRRQGRHLSDPAFAIRVARATTQESRLAIVVSKRVDRRAVVRNRMKRRYREAFRPLLPKLRVCVDLLVLARAPSTTLSYHELQVRVTSALRRLALLS